jgi:putative effector of murein hydrolase
VPVLGVFLTGLAWSAATPERLVAALIVRSATTPVALAWVLRAQQTSTWGPS